MKKRRRLANKMTIMVCAVLCAVSAFFYVSMESFASEAISVTSEIPLEVNEVMTADVASDIGIDASESISTSSGYYKVFNSATSNFTFRGDDYYDADTVYKVELDITTSVTPSVTGTGAYLWAYNFVFSGYSLVHADVVPLNNSLSTSVSRTYYMLGSDLNSSYSGYHRGVVTSSSSVSLSVDVTHTINVVSATPTSEESADRYQEGYDDGYLAGEKYGFDLGYEQGYADGVASVDTGGSGDSGDYEQGFADGVASVDTQSYYDAGYEAGYNIAYNDGYGDGYSSGYDVAMDRIAQWGADISEYPALISSVNNSSWGDWMIPVPIQTADLKDVVAIYDDTFTATLNPNHTYKIVGTVGNLDFMDYDGVTSVASSELYLNIGGNDYLLKSNIDGNIMDDIEIFIEGSAMTKNFAFKAIGHNVTLLSPNTYALLYCDFDFNLYLYDMGPSGDTQNHIANQTDQLTNGYDDSKGNEVNSELSTGLNEYETAENSLFATATTGMNDFTFFDIESVPAMVTGISFITATMSSWFNNAGGASGVGIVLSILFSVMLVAMVLGLYRWYQSRGGND